MSDDKIYDKARLAFQKLSPKSGDLIFIKFPDDIAHEQMSLFARGLQQHIPKDVLVMCAHHGAEIEQISEEQMNRMGWYRKTH